jgi:hypothetical protein
MNFFLNSLIDIKVYLKDSQNLDSEILCFYKRCSAGGDSRNLQDYVKLEF